MHIYRAYNSSSRDYDAIYNKESLLVIAIVFRMLSESVLIENFNLYYTI